MRMPRHSIHMHSDGTCVYTHWHRKHFVIFSHISVAYPTLSSRNMQNKPCSSVQVIPFRGIQCCNGPAQLPGSIPPSGAAGSAVFQGLTLQIADDLAEMVDAQRTQTSQVVPDAGGAG